MIQINLDRDHYTVGETVSGTVTWMPESDAQPRGLVLIVGWRTEGRGNTDTATVWQMRHNPLMVSSASPVQFNFNFPLPTEGPVSYTGNLIRIIWEVTVKVDWPMARDEVEHQRLLVQPRSRTPQ